MTYQILHGNNLDVLPTLADNSIDSIVTDPPYELGFMGKKWDSSGIAYSVELWQQCLRVLKPGGHLLSFGGTRTYHRVAVAIEDAGFELRDSIAWLYGSGFPKSLDVSKAIDKQAGAEREVIGRNPNSREQATKENTLYESGTVGKTAFDTAPSTPEAQQWQGWGTALKPAFEPVIVARKPIEGTVANNVLKWGTGGLNIDASRIGSRDKDESGWAKTGSKASDNVALGRQYDREPISEVGLGRWPANVILGHTQSCQPTGKTIKSKTGAGKRTATFGTQDTQSGGDGSGGWSGYEYETEVYECVDGCPVKLLDEQSGTSKSPQPSDNVPYGAGTDTNSNNILGKGLSASVPNVKPYGDSGGASRFFYVAKASKRDRNEGLEELEEKIKPYGNREIQDVPEEGDRPGSVNDKFTTEPAKNFHPTVKPTSLMEYLIKLVTPPNGTVLDPFTGSGSTGKAAIFQGFDFIGIEMTEEYLPIIEGRLKHAEHIVAERIKETSDKQSEVLF
jgi:site-specific DNA-methyltransferase (adenine-specific)